MVREYAASLKQPRVTQPQRSWRAVTTRSSRYHPFEPWFKLISGFIGINAELYHAHWSLVDKSNEFHKANKFAHASMYGFFAFSGLIELLNFHKLTHFSRQLEYIMLAAAFGIEGMLFFFHLHGRDMFDVRIHTILYTVIFMTALVVIMEACLPKYRRELFMARTVLTLTQGTWFLEIAFTIYGPNRWIVDKMSEKQLMLATEVVTVNVCWHILSWCGFLLICCIITSCLHKRRKLSACCLTGSAVESDQSLLVQRLGGEGEKLDEEKGLLSDEQRYNNNSMDEEIRKEEDEEVYT